MFAFLLLRYHIYLIILNIVIQKYEDIKLHSKYSGFFSLQIVGIYTTVFPLCIFYLTHIILFIIKLSSWHSFFLSRFKNLLDRVSHILKICSLLTHEIYFIAAGASDFVRIIMVQKKKKKPEILFLDVIYATSCSFLISSFLFQRYDLHIGIKDENTTWTSCPSVFYIILENQQ